MHLPKLMLSTALATIAAIVPTLGDAEEMPQAVVPEKIDTTAYIRSYNPSEKRIYQVAASDTPTFSVEETVVDFTNDDDEGSGSFTLEFIEHNPLDPYRGAEFIRFRPDGLFLFTYQDNDGKEHWSEGWPMLPNPLPVEGATGHRTAYNYQPKDGEMEKAHDEIFFVFFGGMHTLETPAGTFTDVIRVNVFGGNADFEAEHLYSDWFAPGVGLVQSQWMDVDDKIHTMTLSSIERPSSE